MRVFFLVSITITFIGFLFYGHIYHVNKSIELRLTLPNLLTQKRRLQEIDSELLFQIECFESPQNLLKIANQPQFAHLFLLENDQIIIDPIDLLQSHPLKREFLNDSFSDTLFQQGNPS